MSSCTNKKPSKYLFIVAKALVLSVFLFFIGCAKEIREQPLTEQPNIILILTDDQNYLSVQHMNVLKAELGKRGAVFTNAIASDPECCPFRSSFLAGGFHPKNTNVKDNSRYGSKKFNNTNTIAVRLQEAGYQTGFIGKYKHGYTPGYVPPGWSSFVANNNGGSLADWMNLRDITYGSSTNEPSTGRIEKEREQYLTYFHQEMALKFLEEYQNDPYFLFISLYAPHAPRTAAPDERSVFPNVGLEEIVEHDLSDKPEWLQRVAKLQSRHKVAVLARKTAVALQPVDRIITQLITKLDESGDLTNTYIIFSSDNGLMFGRHGIQPNKGYPYEDSLRVPLLIRGPGIEPAVIDTPVAANLDLPPTILQIAGLDSKSDGLSLLPLLRGEGTLARDKIYIEYYGYLTNVLNVGLPIVWSGYRTARYKYVEYANGERELYDFVYDPFEHENVADDALYTDVVKDFSKKLDTDRGLTLSTVFPPTGTVGAEYSFQLKVIGGEPPYRFYIGEGRLPEGLSIDENTGLISGTPVKAGANLRLFVEVESNRIASHAEETEKAYWRLSFDINEHNDDEEDK